MRQPARNWSAVLSTAKSSRLADFGISVLLHIEGADRRASRA